MRITIYDTEIDPKTELPVLVKDRSINYESDYYLQNPETIMKLMNDIFRHGYATEEKVYLIAHNNRLKPIGIFEISRGTINGSHFMPREILMKALLAGAASISVCHNHPSNDPSPSKTDLAATDNLKNACQIFGFQLLDHLIICRDNYTSLREKGLI